MKAIVSVSLPLGKKTINYLCEKNNITTKTCAWVLKLFGIKDVTFNC